MRRPQSRGWSLYGAPGLQPTPIAGKSTVPRNHQKQAKSVAAASHRLPENIHGKEGVDGSSPSEGSKDVIPICLTAVSSGDDDAAAAVEVFGGRLQEERGHAGA
jgi:hypothetical protein